MQDSLPAGWLTFAGRELNPLDRDERFPSPTSSSPFPGFILTLRAPDPEATLIAPTRIAAREAMLRSSARACRPVEALVAQYSMARETSVPEAPAMAFARGRPVAAARRSSCTCAHERRRFVDRSRSSLTNTSRGSVPIWRETRLGKIPRTRPRQLPSSCSSERCTLGLVVTPRSPDDPSACGPVTTNGSGEDRPWFRRCLNRLSDP